MPIVIHLALYGSLERFIGIIIENFKGAFPFWLNPCQAAVMPIRPEHNDYARRVAERLEDEGIRVEVGYADINTNTKIRSFKAMKDPYIVVVGDREAAEGIVAITVRGQKQQLHDVPLETLVRMCNRMNEAHSLELIGEVPEV